MVSGTIKGAGLGLVAVEVGGQDMIRDKGNEEVVASRAELLLVFLLAVVVRTVIQTIILFIPLADIVAVVVLFLRLLSRSLTAALIFCPWLFWPLPSVPRPRQRFLNHLSDPRG